MREDSFTLIAVFTIAAVAIIFLRAAILSQTRVVEDLQISPSGWIWKTFGKETLANSIEDLEAMVLWSDRLQLFFPRQTRALLLGFSESHDERCYLFNEILTTLEANGYSLPEVPWETSG